jgi:hypothetical protein
LKFSICSVQELTLTHIFSNAEVAEIRRVLLLKKVAYKLMKPTIFLLCILSAATGEHYFNALIENLNFSSGFIAFISQRPLRSLSLIWFTHIP